jgi:peptidoglycan LD-endopeptidase CwlK
VINRLEGVHPVLVAKVTKILEAMNILGFRMVVTAGVRTVEQQQALYAQGRTRPGNIVTYADGVEKRSNHQPYADGFGHAVDCVFLDEHGRPTWDESKPWHLYGACAQSLGLTWGGVWKMADKPHVELV